MHVISYDRKAFSLLDYTTYRLNLAVGPSVDWKVEYSFSRTYRLFPISATGLETLSRSLKDDAETRATYIDYYNVSNPAMPQMTDQTWPLFWCAIGHLTATPFQACVEKFLQR